MKLQTFIAVALLAVLAWQLVTLWRPDLKRRMSRAVRVAAVGYAVLVAYRLWSAPLDPGAASDRRHLVALFRGGLGSGLDRGPDRAQVDRRPALASSRPLPGEIFAPRATSPTASARAGAVDTHPAPIYHRPCSWGTPSAGPFCASRPRQAGHRTRRAECRSPGGVPLCPLRGLKAPANRPAVRW